VVDGGAPDVARRVPRRRRHEHRLLAGAATGRLNPGGPFRGIKAVRPSATTDRKKNTRGMIPSMTHTVEGVYCEHPGTPVAAPGPACLCLRAWTMWRRRAVFPVPAHPTAAAAVGAAAAGGRDLTDRSGPPVGKRGSEQQRPLGGQRTGEEDGGAGLDVVEDGGLLRGQVPQGRAGPGVRDPVRSTGAHGAVEAQTTLWNLRPLGVHSVVARDQA